MKIKRQRQMSGVPCFLFISSNWSPPPAIWYQGRSGGSAGFYKFRLTLLQSNTECQAFFLVVQIGSPTPSPARDCCSSPPLGPWRKTQSQLAGEGGGGPNSDEGKDTLVLYVYYSPCTVLPHPTYLVSWEGGSAVLNELCLTAAPVLFIPLSLRLVT
jgi:hypothetical protein